jgi:hypothetical protein
VRRLIVLTALLALALAASAPAAGVRPRVVGGTAAATGDYPWQVAVGFEAMGGTVVQYCGGTLVASQWVLTADHCDVYIGDEARIASVERRSGGHVLYIDQVVRHPQADGRGAATPRYDVNLLHLTAPVPDARPLVVGDATTGSALYAPGKLLTITGWGDTAFGAGDGSETMLEARVPRASDPSCATAYGTDFHVTDMICAGYPEGGTDTCQGDSGGPLIAPTVTTPSKRNPAHWRLVGVTSTGNGCAEPGYPGIYARITEPVIRDWITATIPAEAPVDTTLADGATPGEQDETPAVAEDPPADEQGAPDDAADEGDDDGARAPAVAAPLATPAPADPATTALSHVPEAVAEPAITAATRRCTERRRCTFTLTTSAGVAVVKATLTTTASRPCTRGGRRTTCRRTTARRLAAGRRRPGVFSVRTAALRRGAHVLRVTALGADGARAGTRSVRFAVR